MELATKPKLTAREYLAMDRAAERKSEFLDGEMFGMAGGTEAHSLIAGNLIGELRAQLKGKGCRVYTSDMRLKIEKTGLYAYPDVTVACGETRLEDASRDTLLNPKIIFEVLSDSTAAWDRGEKFWHYRQAESVTDYVMVSQDTWLVEHYTRQASGAWLLETLEDSAAVLHLAEIHCQVALNEVYASTDVQPAAKPSAAMPNQKLGRRAKS